MPKEGFNPKPVDQAERFKKLAADARALPPDEPYTGKGLSGVMDFDPNEPRTNAEAAEDFEREAQNRGDAK